MIKKLTALAMVVCLLCGLAACASAPEADEKLWTETIVSAEDEDGLMSYRDYAAYNRELAAGQKAIALFASDYAKGSGETAQKMKRYKGRDDAVIMPQGQDFLEYEVSVPETGMYYIELSYYPIRSEEKEIKLGIMIDDSYPFAEAKRFQLERIYCNAGDFPTDEKGNQQSPKQAEYSSWFDQKLSLANHSVDGPVAFRLSKGTHLVRIITLSGDYALSDIYFRPAKKTPGFGVYANHNGANDGGDQYVKLEAENAAFKNANTLAPVATDEPSGIARLFGAKTELNTVTDWYKPGQWMEWEFDAPATGWYTLSFCYQQNFNKGYYVSRRLLLDGKAPFAEAESLRFDYTTKWQIYTPEAADEQPLALFLEEGYHTIRMEAVLGPYGQVPAKKIDAESKDLKPSANVQPLYLDYIYLHQTDAPKPKK